MEVVANGCAETFWKTLGSAWRLPVSYNVIFRIGNFAPFLQRTSFARESVVGAGWAGGGSLLRQRRGSRSDSHVRKTLWFATHKNKQTDPFAK